MLYETAIQKKVKENEIRTKKMQDYNKNRKL